MTIRLLRDFNGIPSNTIVSFDQQTETALVAQLTATFNLTGGTAFTPNNPYDMTRTMAWSQTPPTSSTSQGIQGQYSFDAAYFYFCIAANQWRRSDLESF